MKIKKTDPCKVIMSNPRGKAGYFAWPSVARLQNGKIAVVASGYRYAHICPFGKGVISYSEDEGETYTVPAPVIDTPLDDRDAGILAFGKSDVIMTSFNNSVQFQRECAGHYLPTECDRGRVMEFFGKALDLITPEEENKYLGSEFCISRDCGVTFGKIYKSPVTSPHGPCALNDGTVLWVGRTFSANDKFDGETGIEAYKIELDGTCRRVGTVPPVTENGEMVMMCEPYALQLPSGKIICHLRAQKWNDSGCVYFTLYQSESLDCGKSWSVPHRILEPLGGAPSHLLLHSSGTLIATYGYREMPYGIKAMFSKDCGETWSERQSIYTDEISDDIGYPCSIELDGGEILTVFYAHERTDGPAVIMQQKWRIEDEI